MAPLTPLRLLGSMFFLLSGLLPCLAFAAPPPPVQSIVVERPNPQGLEQVALYLYADGKMELTRNSNFLSRDLEEKQSSLGVYDIPNEGYNKVLRNMFRALAHAAPRESLNHTPPMAHPHGLRVFINDVQIFPNAAAYDPLIDLVEDADATEGKVLKNGATVMRRGLNSASVRDASQTEVALACQKQRRQDYLQCQVPKLGLVYFAL